jgi:hypothetical protein
MLILFQILINTIIQRCQYYNSQNFYRRLIIHFLFHFLVILLTKENLLNYLIKKVYTKIQFIKIAY